MPASHNGIAQDWKSWPFGVTRFDSWSGRDFGKMNLTKITKGTDQEIKELAARVNRIEKSRFLIDKELSRDYTLAYYPPIISFKCFTEPFYSFKLHIGNFKDKNEESFWRNAAITHKDILFNGHVTKGYINLGMGSLRGYVSILDNNRRLGVYVKKGIVKDLLTEDDLIPYQAWLAESTDISSDNTDNKGRGKKKNAKKD